MRVQGIDHVQIAMPAGCEEAARTFYGEVLGMTEVPKPPELAGRGGAWFEAGSAKIHLGVEAPFAPARKAHPALVVADLQTTIETLRSRGIEVSEPELLEGRLRGFIHDPFGNRIELVEASASA